jgi:methionyl-tRNA synthetase
MKNNFYITTTLPYINSEPHIGFAGEIITADVLARFHRNSGEEVFFNTGTDEHGLKIYRKAEEMKMDTQDFCDELAKKFLELKKTLNLSFDNFIRTTDKNHIEAAQEFWKKCEANGDIYKKMYKIKYCVGCELEKTDSELVDGKCPLHPNQEIECIEEENYFFRFSKYQKKLLDLYEKNPDFVSPKKRLNEIKSFVESGLEDFSVSRMKEKMPWGIEVPGDSLHVMYVWFDALVNYISTLGWPKNKNKFEKFWPGIQIAGKDNLRQQAAMWQAMLFSAGLPNSKRVFIRGFVTNKGEKMSKSQGNFIGVEEMIEKFGTDATRYLLH